MLMENQKYNLSLEELDLLRELSLYSESKLDKSVGNKILSIENWLSSYYHTGEIGKSLFPFWKKELNLIFNENSLNFDEVVVTGGLSTGKSYFSLAVWMRMFYLISLMKDPHGFLGLSKATQIRFAYLSVTKEEAGGTVYQDLVDILNTCKYFNSDFPRDTKIDSVIRFPKHINVIFGSDSSHFIGSNTLSMIYDEANFAKSGGGKPGDIKKATKIYSTSRARIKTRFVRENKPRFYLNMLISSNTHKGSFTEGIITLSKKIETTKIIVSRIFDTKPKGTYSDKKFLFFSGDEVYPPQVVDEKKDLKNILTEEEFDVVDGSSPQSMIFTINPEHILKYHLVPINFYNDCKFYPDQMVQDLIGLSLASTGQFFRNKKEFASCVNKGESIGLHHPFTREWIYLNTGDNTEIKDYLNISYLKAAVGERKCFLHIDQSTSTAYTGMGLSFSLSSEDGPPKVVVPLMLQIRPPEDKSDKISLEKIRNFVEFLVDGVGLNLAKTTFDQFQSSYTIETLNKRSINADLFSLDRGVQHWHEVAGLFHAGRVVLYSYDAFKSEWFNLILDRSKNQVVKPENGRKDVADSVCGSIYQCMLDFGTHPDEKRQNETLNTILEGMRKNQDPDLNKILTGQDIANLENLSPNQIFNKIRKGDGDLFFGNQ
jgi:hypothetical protein